MRNQIGGVHEVLRQLEDLMGRRLAQPENAPEQGEVVPRDRNGPNPGDLLQGGPIVTNPVADEVAPPRDGGPEVGRRPREAAGVVGRGLDERGRRRGPVRPPDLGWEHQAGPVREPPRERGGRLDREPNLDWGPMGARRGNHLDPK
ncbi:hypothetical protein L484_018314 [Morus notabilis]|uniref:Uncharacterized protein n=1 Tax=Morus notabilis TaxID=981085 RepID=W9QRC8_9ROSA|nr:hypothetical protein L484_018314 [Morus notabilis]